MCSTKYLFADIIYYLFRTQIFFFPTLMGGSEHASQRKSVCVLIYVQFTVECLWWTFPTSDFCMRFQHVSDLGVAWDQSFWIESDWISIIWNYLPVWLIGTQTCLWWFVTQHYCGNRVFIYSTFKEMSTIQNRK